MSRGVAQFGRVLGLGPRCRRFEPCHLDHRVATLLRQSLLPLILGEVAFLGIFSKIFSTKYFIFFMHPFVC